MALTVAAQAQMDLAFEDKRQSMKLENEAAALRKRAKELMRQSDQFAARASERMGLAVNKQDDPGLYDEAIEKMNAVAADAVAAAGVSTYESGLEANPNHEPPAAPAPATRVSLPVIEAAPEPVMTTDPVMTTEPVTTTADQAVALMRARDEPQPIPAHTVGASRHFLESLRAETRLFPTTESGFLEHDKLGTVGQVMTLNDQEWVVLTAQELREETRWVLHPVHAVEDWGDGLPRTWRQIWEKRGDTAPENIPLKGLLVTDEMGIEWVCGFDEERIVLSTMKGAPTVEQPPPPPPADPPEGKSALRAWYHQHGNGAPPLTEHRLETLARLPGPLKPLMLDPNVNDFGVFERGIKSYAVHTIPKTYGEAEVCAAKDLEGTWWAGGSFQVQGGTFEGHASSPAIRASATRYESLSAAIDQELLEFHNSLQRVGEPGNKIEIKARDRMRQGIREFRQLMKAKIKEFEAGTWQPQPEPPEPPKLKEPKGRRTVDTHKKQSAKAWYSVFRETLRTLNAPRKDPGLKHPDVVALYNRYVEDDLRPADAARLFAGGGASNGRDFHKDMGKCSLGSWVGGLKQCLKSKAMKERVKYDPKTKTAAPEVMDFWAAGIHVQDAAKQLEALWRQK